MALIEQQLCHRGYPFCEYVPVNVWIWAKIVCQYGKGFANFVSLRVGALRYSASRGIHLSGDHPLGCCPRLSRGF